MNRCRSINIGGKVMNSSPSPNRNLTPFLLLLLAAIAVPAAAVLAFAKAIAQSPLLAVGLFLLYEVAVFTVGTVGRVWQKLESRWSDQIAEWIAIRVSGFLYVRYYSQQLFYQHRDFDVKGLSTQSTY